MHYTPTTDFTFTTTRVKIWWAKLKLKFKIWGFIGKIKGTN